MFTFSTCSKQGQRLANIRLCYLVIFGVRFPLVTAIAFRQLSTLILLVEDTVMLSVIKPLNEPAAHACCVLLTRSCFEVSLPGSGLVLGLSIFSFLVNTYLLEYRRSMTLNQRGD